MKILRNLRLEEFSIVRGSDKQPANPEATVLRYKTEINRKESNMEQQTATTPEERKKSLPGQIADAVKSAIGKAKQQRTTIQEYQSTSRTVETLDGAEGQSEGMTPAEMATEKAQQPLPPQTAPAPPAQKLELDPAVFETVLDPVIQKLTEIDARLEKVEKTSTGSRQIKHATRITVESAAGEEQFPEFTKFLAEVGGLTPGQRLSKATITTSGWSYGLAVDEANRFIDYIVDESTLLKRVRTERMTAPTRNIDKIGLGGNVLVKGTPGVDPGDTVSLSGPTQVQLQSAEVVAIVSVGDDTLEDNIEGDAFIQHLLRMIARSAANELEQAAIHGDTGVADTGILDRWDGWYKLAKNGGAQVIEAMADADRYWPGQNGSKATRVLKALPTKYRQDLRNLAWILHSDLYLDYNEELASKGYSEAWSAITGIRDVPLRGIQNVQVPLMKTDMQFTYNSTNYTDGTIVILTDLRNLIFGIQRDIRIEPFRQPRKRATDWVLSMRAAVQIENAEAIAIYDHAAVKS